MRSGNGIEYTQNDLIDSITHPPVVERLKIWERLEGEPNKAFGAFIVYRNLATKDRSLRKSVEQIYGEVNPTRMRQFQAWSSRYGWVSRSAAWDDELDRQAQEEQIKMVKEMRSRHIRIAQAIQQKAVERLKTTEAIELSVQDVLSFLLAGSRMERQAVGEPEEVLRSETLIAIQDFSQMSPEDLRKALRQRILSMQDTTFPEMQTPITLSEDNA